MKKAPNLYQIPRDLRPTNDQNFTFGPGGWRPARPLGFYSFWFRLRVAWLVFCGEADAVQWPEEWCPPSYQELNIGKGCSK